jgi:hypothetical protein
MSIPGGNNPEANISDAPPIKKEDPRHVGDPNSLKVGELPASIIEAHKKSKPGAKKLGIGSDEVIQSVPKIPKGKGEKHILHTNFNGGICFGSDRPSDRLSGYGGAAVKNSNTIDICVGRMGPSPRTVTKNNKELFAENNFSMDSARIYISQRTDIDHNFSIRTKTTSPASNCAAIGIKADSIRIIGRSDVRIISGVDYSDSKGLTPGVDYSVPHRICLIGDNKDELLQPMVKGDSLKQFIDEFTKEIHSVLSMIQAFLNYQNQYNMLIANHTHIVGVPGKEGIFSFDGITEGSSIAAQQASDIASSIISTTANIQTIYQKYFEMPNDAVANTDNVLSNYNFCN